ncbi:unnamed protein product [Candidula unifasciata]|uniref:Transgelin n=1 Tax=Candidula unifasciata TaxID=100452 RepID=A0A8S3ZJH7_9EUPU|nr:unnamed protein product [Candidula unifasciata]
MDAKWDPERAITAISWISQRIGRPLSTDGSRESCHQILMDGVVLGELANWIKPGTIAASKLSKPPTMAFKRMELIGLFLDCIDESKGGLVKKDELFQTVDLYEDQNMVQVCLCFEALGRALNTIGREGFGKAESKGQHHEWSQEQLNAGKGIIGLQMGSNKGANQSGQNFGKGRDIMS